MCSLFLRNNLYIKSAAFRFCNDFPDLAITVIALSKQGAFHKIYCRFRTVCCHGDRNFGHKNFFIPPPSTDFRRIQTSFRQTSDPNDLHRRCYWNWSFPWCRKQASGRRPFSCYRLSGLRHFFLPDAQTRISHT